MCVFTVFGVPGVKRVCRVLYTIYIVLDRKGEKLDGSVFLCGFTPLRTPPPPAATARRI
jgi:hypothetical protein